MNPTGSFPFAQHLSIRHPRWARAFARTQDADLETMPEIPGYELEKRVGEGRMAKAYLAQDLARGGKVVLKVMRPGQLENEARTTAFLQEFAVPHAIHDDHVVRVIDQSVSDGNAYLAMEYLGGGHLGRLIRCGLTPSESLALLRQAALGLAAVHAHGFVHCDVKPANLLLRYSGDLVLADFGVARRNNTAPHASHTGLVIGTPCYASPELAQGGAVQAATDIYSLGVVFYEMLCGKPPFPGHTLMEVFCQHLMAPVPRLPHELVRLQPLVDRMLQKQPGNRPRDGQALLQQIDFIQDAGPLHISPPGATGNR
jgi:serine/threonine-protein kinase PpkA